MCTFCGVHHVQQQLDSIAIQHRVPDSILILDDASDDGTWTVVNEWMKSMQQAAELSCRVLRNDTRLGVVANFSRALSLADADVIVAADQDDVWYADKLARLVAEFERRPDLLLLHTDARLVDAAGQPLGMSLFEAMRFTRAERARIHRDEGFAVYVCRSAATGATMAFRRELVELALPIGGGWIHDEWLAIVAAAIGRVDVIEDCLIDYRQHGANAVGMRVRTLRDKWDDLCKPRAAQFRHEIERLSVLEQRLLVLGARVATWKLDLLRTRIAHMQRRVVMGHMPHWRRLPAIWCEWRQGHYMRFGTGLRTAIRDLLRRD